MELLKEGSTYTLKLKSDEFKLLENSLNIDDSFSRTQQRIMASIREAVEDARLYPFGERKVRLSKNILECFYELTWEKAQENPQWVAIYNKLEETKQNFIHESKIPSFRKILEESKQTHSFRIKTVAHLDDDGFEKIKKVLAKYSLLSITDPSKTIVHRNPMDFPDVDHSEVFIMDAVLEYPVSYYVLQQELRSALGISEKYIIVKTDNEPVEMEVQRRKAVEELDAATKEDFSKVYMGSLLDTESVSPESEYSVDGSEMYGDKYNSRFLEYLAQIAATRRPENFDAPAPLFSWLNMNIEDVGDTERYHPAAFNDHIEGAPKPVNSWDVEPVVGTPHGKMSNRVSNHGNYDDNNTKVVRTYTDHDGKTTLKHKPIKIRGDSK